jgi:hypothetical protein
MGCDIHFYVERRTQEGWKIVLPPCTCPPDMKEEEKRWGCLNYWGHSTSTNTYGLEKEWDLGRNYALFTVLSDVRNDCPENKPIHPTVDCLPPDCDPIIAVDLMGWGIHSLSVYTLPELLDHNWDSPFYERGVIGVENAVRLANGENPNFLEGWCGDKSGPDIKVLYWDSHRQQDVVNRGRDFSGHSASVLQTNLYSKGLTGTQILELANKVGYTDVEMVWSWPQRRACKHFVETVIPAMQKIDVEPENVRAVFAYDN